MGWNDKLTELNRILADLYREKDRSYRIVEMAGIPTSGIAFNNAAIDNWFYILKEANQRNKVNNIVEIAVHEYPSKADELKKLYQQVNNKKVMQTADNFHLNDLKRLVRSSETEKAIAELEKIAQKISPDFYNSVIMQSAKLNRAKRDKMNGIVSHENHKIDMARIEYALLSLIDSIPKEKQLLAMLSTLNEDIGVNPTEQINLIIPDNADLEKVMGREELFEVNWIQKALSASRSVCKVLLSNNESGTGFMLKGGYLLTNNHVLPSTEAASNAKIIFNYLVNAQEDIESISEYSLDTSVFYTSLENELDYTLVKIKDDASGTLSKWGNVLLDDFSDPQIEDKVNIIQHPEGKYMKIALPDKIISKMNQYLFYIADTKEGSSGSPVFNQDWKVIALHHAGLNDKSQEGGLIINEAGDKKPSNRGILIKNIIKDLKDKGFEL